MSSGRVLRVVLGDWVYVGVQLFSSDPKLKLILEQCYASPSPTPDNGSVYYLIRHRFVIRCEINHRRFHGGIGTARLRYVAG